MYIRTHPSSSSSCLSGTNSLLSGSRPAPPIEGRSQGAPTLPGRSRAIESLPLQSRELDAWMRFEQAASLARLAELSLASSQRTGEFLVCGTHRATFVRATGIHTEASQLDALSPPPLSTLLRPPPPSFAFASRAGATCTRPSTQKKGQVFARALPSAPPQPKREPVAFAADAGKRGSHKRWRLRLAAKGRLLRGCRAPSGWQF